MDHGKGAFRPPRGTALAAIVTAVVLLGSSIAGAAEYSKQSWDELVRKAKQEGEVVVVGSTGRARRNSRTKPFEKKYGIKVTYLAGNQNDMMEKIITEYRTGVHGVDVWSGGARNRTQRLSDAGIIQKLTPLLVLPEVTDQSLFYKGHYWWTVKDLGMLTAAYPAQAFSYNTNKIKPGDIKSWWDMLQPKYKGRIGVVEPDPGTASGTMVFQWQLPTVGKNWFIKLIKEMNPGIHSDGALATERLARGVYDICLYNLSDARVAKRQGLPVNIRVTPLAEGAELTAGGSNHLMAFAKPPHPNAQKLWINWFLSREGQLAFQHLDRDYQSIRNDLPTDMLPQDLVRKPGVQYHFIMADPNARKWAAEANKFWYSMRP